MPFIPEGSIIWEPAAGNDKIVNVLKTKFPVVGTDIVRGNDFFVEPKMLDITNSIITNPPYKNSLAQRFAEHALALTMERNGFVAMLLRTDFDHAKNRRHLFRDCYAFMGKVVLLKRIVWFVEDNGKPKASPSENHAWFLWDWENTDAPTIRYMADER